MCEIESFQYGELDYRNIPRGLKRSWMLSKEPSILPPKSCQLLVIKHKIIFVLFTFSLFKCIIYSITLAELSNLLQI